MSVLTSLHELTGRRFNGTSIAIARMLIGGAALLQCADSAPVLTRLLQPNSVRTPLISGLPVITEAVVPLFLSLWLLAALAFAIGLRTRLSGTVLAMVLGYSILIDQQTYSNHVYLMAIVAGLIACAGSGNRFSVDAYLGRGQESIPVWPSTLIKLQLSIVYFFAAVSKLNVMYLSGAVIAPQVQNSWLIPMPESWIRWETIFPLVVASIAVEMYLAFAFWLPRHRRAAFATGATLHLAILAIYPASGLLPLSIFALVMFAMYAQFMRFETKPMTALESKTILQLGDSG